jgi:hypothetical protein
MRWPMGTDPAYFITLISRCLRSPLSLEHWLKLQYKTDISSTEKHFITRGVGLITKARGSSIQLGFPNIKGVVSVRIYQK